VAKSNQPLLHVIILLITILSACISTPAELPPTTANLPTITPANTLPAYWYPSPSDRFQLQLSDYPPDLSIEADVFELDLFETPQDVRVICYINVGAWEEYRPDAADFPNAVIDKKYIGWDGERWLDISSYAKFSGLIIARFDMATNKGCDGIDPDNINGFQQDTGFFITAQDQLAYNIWLSEQAHLRSLSIGLKNNSDQISELLDYFDFALIEDCTVYGECADFLPFIEQGKAVFQIEYTDKFYNTFDFCSTADANGYYGIFKNRKLDA
jgi:hypothetical protein